MSQTIKLMMVHQIGKAFIKSIDNIICVQISVRLLSSADDID